MPTTPITKAYLSYREAVHEFLKGNNKNLLDERANSLNQVLKKNTASTPFQRHLNIDFHPEVFTLRHRLIQSKKELTPTVYKKLFLEYINACDKAAISNDYTTYKQAIFELDNLDETRIKSGLAQLLTIDEKERNTLLHKYNITNDTFFNSLHSIGPKPKHTDKWKILNSLVKHFEYDNFQQSFCFDTATSHNDTETILYQNGDIVVRTPTINTMYDLKIYLHELSKAIVIFYHESESKNRFLRQSKLIALSTMIEIMLEDIVCTATEKKYLNQIRLLENSYYAGHALFEFDLHDERKRPEKIYIELINPLYRVDDHLCWAHALMVHGNLMSMHYKPIGYIMAQNLKVILKKERVRKRKRPRWLKDNILRRSDEVGMDALI